MTALLQETLEYKGVYSKIDSKIDSRIGWCIYLYLHLVQITESDFYFHPKSVKEFFWNIQKNV